MYTRARLVVPVLIGVAGLLLKERYTGPGQVLVHSYMGNVSVSFAVYFLARAALGGTRRRRLLSGVLALAVVEAFEVLDGFGVMANVYDPVDLAANAVGVVAAATFDRLRDRSGIRVEEPGRGSARPGS